MKKIKCQVCLEEQDGVLSTVYLQDINTMKKEEMKCKFKMSHLEEIICLKLAIHMKIMDVKICRRRASPIMVYGGAIRKTSSCKHNQERRSILVRSRSSSSSSSGMRKIRFSLDRVSILGLVAVLSRGLSSE